MSIKLIIILLAVILIFLVLISAALVLKLRSKKTSVSTELPTTLVDLRAGEHKLALNHGGRLRPLTVYLPIGYNKNQPYPVVFSLHGGGSNAAEQVSLNDLNQVADQNGFIVVYPNGLGNNWNDGRAWTAEKSSNSDDVAFIKLIIQKLGQWVNLDSSRIYSTGISNGGMMSLRLACDAADTFAAVAPVAAALPAELKVICTPSQPVSVLGIQGTTDPLVPYSGGSIGLVGGAAAEARGTVLSATESFNFWVSLNKCTQPAKVSSLADTDPNDGTTSSQVLYEKCEQNTQVGLTTITNGGHTWPGGKQYLGERLIGKTSRDFSASEVIWEFFKTKARP